MARPLGSDLDQLLLPEGPVTVLPSSLQIKIIKGFWKTNSTPLQSSDFHIEKYSAYFQYFASECRAWKLNGVPIAIQTYRDLLDLVQHLKANKMERRDSPQMLAFFPPVVGERVAIGYLAHPPTTDEMRLPLATRHRQSDKESIRNSIDFAARVWLMLNIGAPQPTFHPGRSNLSWDDSESLQSFMEASFPPSQPHKDGLQWTKSMNTVNLHQIGGFEIIWTDNLADHLLLNEDLETISIYHHVSILQAHKNAQVYEYASSRFSGWVTLMTLQYSQVLPVDLLVETLDAIALLIPRASKSCKKWYQKAQKRNPGCLDPKAGDLELHLQCRRVSRYTFWNDRLSTIQNSYGQSEPGTIHQWWNDRRKRVQWYTFWVAILVLLLTIVFGLIQSVTSILQVYLAYRPPATRK